MSFVSIVLLSSVSIFIFLAVVKRRRSSKVKRCNVEKQLDGKVVVITGANCGLGRQLALELFNRKACVVLACRDLDKANDAITWIKNNSSLPENEICKNLHALHLDLASLVSVEAFVKDVTKNFDKLHVLVNNAGIMNAPFGLTPGGVESTFGVNHLGHFHLTNLLLSPLRRSAPSRIVIVSSGYYRKMKTAEFGDLKSCNDYHPLMAYAKSKLANCLHGLGLSVRLKQSGVDVAVVRPGFVRGTQLGRHFSRVSSILFYPMIWFMSKNVDEGVQTMLHCCLTDELKTGGIYDNCTEESYDIKLVNEENGERLWQLSEKMIDDCLAIEKKRID